MRFYSKRAQPKTDIIIALADGTRTRAELAEAAGSTIGSVSVLIHRLREQGIKVYTRYAGWKK